MSTVFIDRMRREIWDVLQLILTDEVPPVIDMPRLDSHTARWVKPRPLVEVEVTEDIRHPSFKALRENKDAS